MYIKHSLSYLSSKCYKTYVYRLWRTEPSKIIVQSCKSISSGKLKTVTVAINEDLDEMPHDAAFNQGMHSLQT